MGRGKREREERRGTGEGREKHGKRKGWGRGDRRIKVSYSAVIWSTSRKLQLLDTCRGARCFDCVTDDAAYLAVMDQVSHWLQ